MDLFILSGVGLGLVFGFALQRGRFCMNSASRDALLLRDFTLLKAVGAAVIVEMIGFALLDVTGVQAIMPKPFFWAANLLGSFTFGVGMVLAGACASGLSYRVGEGLVSALVAAAGLTAGAYFTAGGGFLNPTAASLQSTVVKTADGANLTLANVLGLPYWVAALILAAIAIVAWVVFANPFKNHAEDIKMAGKGWDWMTTGVVIGLIGIVGFPLSVAAGRASTIGITDGWLGLFKAVFQGGTWGFAPLFIVGLIVGAFAAALLKREFKFRSPSAGMLLQVFIGGLLMGFGAVCSGGCNITHVLGGLPQLSIGSIVASLSIVAGAWVTAYLIFNVFRKAPAA